MNNIDAQTSRLTSENNKAATKILAGMLSSLAIMSTFAYGHAADSHNIVSDSVKGGEAVGAILLNRAFGNELTIDYQGIGSEYK